MQLTSKSFSIFDQNWFVRSDHDHFLLVCYSKDNLHSKLALLHKNKDRIIKEGVWFCGQLKNSDQKPNYLVLTEDVFNFTTNLNKKTYEKAYLKLAISEDEAGVGFFLIQTVFDKEMLKGTNKSIDGLEVERFRLNNGCLRELV